MGSPPHEFKMIEALIGAGIILGLNILLATFAYGRMTEKVKQMGNDVTHISEDISTMRAELKSEIKNIYVRINDIDQRLSRLEGRLS